MIWRVGGREIDVTKRGLIMGILNTTPDSFSDGGRYARVEDAVKRGREMIAEGADLIDVGGESTRPGAEEVGAREEMERVIPVIESLRGQAMISVDTSKPEVARAALKAGADVINDVTGVGDAEMRKVCAESDCGMVAMHMQGTPRTMQEKPVYQDVVKEVRGFFEKRLRELVDAGIAPERVCFDPGIGFGKSLEHNRALLSGLAGLQVADRPILMGLSRKSFFAGLIDAEEMKDREAGTIALSAWTRSQGARIHRVHSVRENRLAIRAVEAMY